MFDKPPTFEEHAAAEKRLEERITALLAEIPNSLFDPNAPDPYYYVQKDFVGCPTKYREEIIQLRRLVWKLQRALGALQLANKVTSEHHWFTLKNWADYGIDPDKIITLFTLSEHGAHRVCSLAAGDMLLVASKDKGEAA